MGGRAGASVSRRLVFDPPVADAVAIHAETQAQGRHRPQLPQVPACHEQAQGVHRARRQDHNVGCETDFASAVQILGVDLVCAILLAQEVADLVFVFYD